MPDMSDIQETLFSAEKLSDRYNTSSASSFLERFAVFCIAGALEIKQSTLLGLCNESA